MNIFGLKIDWYNEKTSKVHQYCNFLKTILASSIGVEMGKELASILLYLKI